MGRPNRFKRRAQKSSICSLSADKRRKSPIPMGKIDNWAYFPLRACKSYPVMESTSSSRNNIAFGRKKAGITDILLIGNLKIYEIEK